MCGTRGENGKEPPVAAIFLDNTAILRVAREARGVSGLRSAENDLHRLYCQRMATIKM